MKLKSGAGSICGVAVVDRSVSFMRPDLQLSESKIYQRLDAFHIGPHSEPRQVTRDWIYCDQRSGIRHLMIKAYYQLSLISTIFT